MSLGKSRFAVEVERLRNILTLSIEGNLLFLLDEILGGTNSEDRLAGANEIIERLIRSDAIGLVTTHDLVLTQVADHLDKRAIRVHFREYYLNGEMRFDYQMRQGNLAHTNGRNVMAALGIMPLSKAGEPSDNGTR